MSFELINLLLLILLLFSLLFVVFSLVVLPIILAYYAIKKGREAGVRSAKQS